MAARIRLDFTTLTLTPIPVAIIINIVVGQIVQNVLKQPVYFDSIGTILFAILAGPLAGALTGVLSNFLWGVIFSTPTIIPFALTATAIGLMAGILAQLGWFRRELLPAQGLALVAVVGAVLLVLPAAPLSMRVQWTRADRRA